MKWLRRIIKLNRLYLFIKTVDELKKQNKEIKKRITHEELIKKEKQDTINIEIIKWDMESFF